MCIYVEDKLLDVDILGINEPTENKKKITQCIYICREKDRHEYRDGIIIEKIKYWSQQVK